MDSDTRTMVADGLRALAAGGTAILAWLPIGAPVVKLVTGLVELAATLVEKVGAVEARVILEEVVANPARVVTDADLDAGVDVVARELGFT